MMKGIKICGDCANYDWKKHKCKICKDKGKPTDPFYTDCPLPDVEEVKHSTKENKYIRIDDAIKIICYECSVQHLCALNGGRERCKRYNRLANFRAADVEEVRHGEWEVIPPPKKYVSGTFCKFRCSECDTVYECSSRFCPNCGARMDGKEQRNGQD